MKYVFLDVETTGLSKINDRIIEMSAFEVIDNKITGAFLNFLVNPEINKPLTPENIKIHGIKDDMLRNATPLKSRLKEVMDFFSKTDILIAHNAKFDTEFLLAGLNRCDSSINLSDIAKNVLCTAKLARLVVGRPNRGPQHSLNSLCHRFNIDNKLRKEGVHSGLLDAILAYKVFKKLETCALQMNINLQSAFLELNLNKSSELNRSQEIKQITL